ncbi:MAG TPA: DUF362 domain-containing protein [Spirochaetota bacterium]|nr:DUF362 domain-containing protein [Spirochaetota bacterium]HPC41171.1 DUF362 domain-containing protein [Spirochaetota bacterium]HPL19063.1 DUF362 domain-containing protein [Spirochaetota bacterium]HQF07091.1 DUF362 domain-containing protein [Spirochaetota bacterium]HQH95828.1 DUF362 domain-containing protein [Spirochaetota bacterium]
MAKKSFDPLKSAYIKKLGAGHGQKTFTEFRPLAEPLRTEVDAGVREIFDFYGGKKMLKPGGDVYIKPNAVDSKPYAFTRPEVLEAAVRYWKEAGAGNIYVFENSTQCNITRLVFEITGYAKICRKLGAIPVYLDEEETVEVAFSDKPGSGGSRVVYDRNTYRISKTVADIIARRNEVLYINLPKLKTHSMGVVTLGIKNQWAFPRHEDRGYDHNYNLHSKLADVLARIRPDFTLIDGVEGSIYGHYNALALADTCVKPFGLLIGSPNVVAADIVGARVFGYDVKDVPHLRLAVERKLGDGVAKLVDITIHGDYRDMRSFDVIGDLKKFGGKYPFDLFQEFPSDVRIIKGKEMACREGCVNNPLAVLQTLSKDFRGRGGWTLVMGKGFDRREIDSIQGPVLIAGHCAIEELGDALIRRLGTRLVYRSGLCNDLQATTESMCRLMKVNPMKMAPVNPVVSLYCIARAFMNKTHGKLVNPAAHLFKLR